MHEENGLTAAQRLCDAADKLTRQDAPAALKVLEPVCVVRLTNAQMDRLSELFEAIPLPLRQKSAPHCMQSLELAYETGDQAAFQRWYAALTALRAHQKEGTPQYFRLEQMMGCAGMLRTGTDNAQLMMALAILYNDATGPDPVWKMSATNRRPSVLRGTFDLSQWGRNDKAVRSILRPMLGTVLAYGGDGVAEAAAAELLYQKNDLNGAARCLPAATTAKDPEIRFAGFATLAQLYRFEPSARDPQVVLGKIGEMLKQEGTEWLTENYQALLIQFDVTAGRLETVRSWVEKRAGDGFESCCPRNRFLLMVRVQALIALGRDREAAMLSEQILLSLRQRFTPLDQIECLVDGAIAWERTGSHEQAMQSLTDALCLAQPYGYVRVFADKGRAALDLLAVYGRERSLTPESARFIRTLSEAAKNFTILCPVMYAPACAAHTINLTATEVQLLHLLGDGKSNRQIGAELSISVSTVKFHMHNLFEKLNVTSRVEALSAAKQQGVL